MLDIRFVREHPDEVKENIKKKFQDAKLPLVDEVINLDAEYRAAIGEGDTLRANRNKLSKQIGMLMGQAKKDPSKAAEAEEIKKQVTAQADRLKELETKEAELQDKIRDIMYTIPQMIDPSVPIGPDDSCNVEVQRFGDPVVPDYPIPYHVDIMESFDGIDLDAAGRVSGNGFYYLLGDIARLHEYTRCKYEHDLKVFQLANYARLTCIYMDAVGLHEINNHLGHEAGDHMLCSIADGIRKYFPDDCAYRIGGDEFVLLCPARQPEELAESLAAFCDTIREMGYEVSVGVSESTDRQTLNETVNQAETAMRHDKMEFYRNNGGIRQMRIIDDKLKQLLIKKRDVTRFLQAIAPLYRGVYMVNPKQDTCRYIYVPSYFKTMLENNHHAFMSSVREYCRELVHPEYHDEFAKLLYYSYIEEQIAAHGSLKMTYQIRDGSRVHLKITMADRSSADAHELLWIFLDETQ